MYIYIHDICVFCDYLHIVLYNIFVADSKIYACDFIYFFMNMVDTFPSVLRNFVLDPCLRPYLDRKKVNLP